MTTRCSRREFVTAAAAVAAWTTVGPLSGDAAALAAAPSAPLTLAGMIESMSYMRGVLAALTT